MTHHTCSWLDFIQSSGVNDYYWSKVPVSQCETFSIWLGSGEIEKVQALESIGLGVGAQRRWCRRSDLPGREQNLYKDCTIPKVT